MGAKRAYKKRKYTKKAVSIPKRPSRLSYPGICPDVMCVQLKYNRAGAFTGAAPQSNVFRGNSVFDPDYSGVGAQPRGFDQWKTLYRRYRVIASKVTARGGTIAASNASGIVVTALNTNTVIGNPVDALESNFAECSKVGTSQGDSSMTVTNYKSTATVRGGPKDLVQYESDLSALVSANPAQQWYWHVLLYNADGTTGTVDSNINVEIIYYVEFYDRETLSQS